jgi:hypothetical protein
MHVVLWQKHSDRTGTVQKDRNSLDIRGEAVGSVTCRLRQGLAEQPRIDTGSRK